MDGVVEEGEYNVQRKLLQDRLESLVIPEVDTALHAGEFLENLGLIWEKATLEEKHRLLSGILDAVYIDLMSTRSIVGLFPKPPFCSLFQSMRQKLGSNVIVFTPDQSGESVVGTQKENAPVGSGREMVGMVETGEGRTTPETTILCFV